MVPFQDHVLKNHTSIKRCHNQRQAFKKKKTNKCYRNNDNYIGDFDI